MSTSAERWSEGPGLVESVWRYRWLVLGATLVAGAIGFAASQAQPEVYEASTRLYLTDPSASGVFDQEGDTDLERYVPQQAQQVTSTRVLEAAAELLDREVSPDGLRSVVEAESDVELTTLSITATDGTAEGAATIANAVSEAYQETVRETHANRVSRATDELEGAAEEIESQIAELDAPEQPDAAAGAQTQIGVLTQRLVEIDTLSQQLRVDARLFGSGVEFVEEAEPPGAPTSPQPRRTAAGAGVLGGMVAAAVAYWLAGRSQRITSRDRPGEILGVPLLGVLPTYQVPTQGTLRQRTTLEPRLTEAYRFVSSTLELIARDIGATSVMITSAQGGAGKTETALQLAATAARRGKRTLLVDGDVRMRGLTTFLHADRASGLLELSADTAAEDTRQALVTYRLNAQQELDVLPAGRSAVDDTGEISEWWFGKLLDGLTREHELTVIDSPPLLAVADTATIAAYSDAIVLVVREGTTVTELERVHQRLRFVGQRLIGYVYLTPTALEDTNFDYGLVRSQAYESLGPSEDAPTVEQQRAESERPDSPTVTPRAWSGGEASDAGRSTTSGRPDDAGRDRAGDRDAKHRERVHRIDSGTGDRGRDE